MKSNILNCQPDYRLDEESSLIARAKSNPEEFEEIYKKYYRNIYKYVCNRIEDRDLVADIVSQVFLKALDNLHRYEYKGVPFASWLYRIAKSEVYQSFRDEKSTRIVHVDVTNLKHFLQEGEDDKASEIEEREKRLLNKLKCLKPDELSLIEMRFFEKRSFKEISEILYITENNAKVRCFRVVKKLKELL